MTEKTPWLTFAGFLILIVVAAQWCSAKSRIAPVYDDDKTNKLNYITSIKWDKPYYENGNTIIPGSTQADFGRFNFLCCIDAEGRGSIVTIEAPGAGEMPKITQKIFILINENGTTTLLQQWLPLLGSKEPEKLKALVTVKTSELFSVLPKPEINSNGHPDDDTLKAVKWGKIQRKGDTQYLLGKVKSTSGTFEFLWKVPFEKAPEIVVWEAPFAGDKALHEKKLYLWDDPSTGITNIYEERVPLVGQKGSVILWPIVKVKTKILLGKLQEVQKKEK